MRLVLILLAMFSVGVLASPLEGINRESSVCLERKYSDNHMRNHPLQTVRSIAMQLYLQPDQKDNTIYLNMQIETRRASYDAFMICDRSDQGLRCGIECDGGQAEIVRINGRERPLQFVNRGFLMSGGCGASEGQDEVWLEPVPNGDDVFELEHRETCE